MTGSRTALAVCRRAWDPFLRRGVKVLQRGRKRPLTNGNGFLPVRGSAVRPPQLEAFENFLMFGFFVFFSDEIAGTFLT